MKIVAPKVWAVRRAQAGVTHERGVVEARGRKKKWNAVQTNRVFVKRRKMQHNTLHDSTVPYSTVHDIALGALVGAVARAVVAAVVGAVVGAVGNL